MSSRQSRFDVLFDDRIERQESGICWRCSCLENALRGLRGYAHAWHNPQCLGNIQALPVPQNGSPVYDGGEFSNIAWPGIGGE